LFRYQELLEMIARSLPFPTCLAFILCLAGCGKSNSRRGPAAHPLPSPPLISKGEPGIFGSRFVLASPAGPKTFNPLLSLDSGSDAVVRFLFGSLVRFDHRSLEPGPGLAESWAVEPDQKTWTFKLRRELFWSDGQSLTAEDVVFTWNDIMYNPQFNRFTFGVFQAGGRNFTVTNLDALTVRVVTPEVFAPFLEFFGSVPILPKHGLQAAVKLNTFLSAYNINTPPSRIIGCGPFRLKECRPGKFTLLQRNPEFWMADQQGRRLPYVEEVMITVAGGPGGAARLFLDGKCDVCETVRPEQFGEFKLATAKGRCRLVEMGPGPERDFLWFNQNTGANAAGQPFVNPAKLKWFRNKKFRQAVSCAIDRDRIVREVYGGRAQATYGFLSTENPKWNNPNVARYGFDPARARRLLAEVGMTQRNTEGVLLDSDGHPLEILFHSNLGNPLREKAAVLIQEDLKRLGIKLLYLPVSFEVLRKKVDVTFDYECALMGLGGGGADPATQINVLRSSEDLHQWFPSQPAPATDWEARIDTLMDAQMRTVDFAERKKAFDEVQAILSEELPMIYTVSPFASAALRLQVGNLRPSVFTPYRLTWNLEELYFKK
jgi:peptide/nickel transport system substrate-binding protein